MKLLGMTMVWYRPHPKGWSDNNRPPDKPSKIAHLFGGPNAPDSLCGKWIVWHPPAGSDKKTPRCPECVRLLRRLKSRPVRITLSGHPYQRSLDYELYKPPELRK